MSDKNISNSNKDNQFSTHPILDKIMRETEKQINEKEFNVFFHFAKEAFGHNMRNFSLVKRIFLNELASLTDLSRSQLEDYQNGIGEFNFEEICRIAFVLGVKMKDMFRE